LLRDLVRGDDPVLTAAIGVIVTVKPDILVLTDIDYDAGGAALGALRDALAAGGADFPYWLQLRPNSGIQTGLDMNGDGWLGDASDGLGFGKFAGDGGMAILSRYPIDREAVVDLSGVLWADLPGASLPLTPERAPILSEVALARLPVSSNGHWIVPVEVEGLGRINILAYDATTPVFDGIEDMNGLRNGDETRLWQLVLDGWAGPAPVDFVIAGNANLDPEDGEGHGDTIRGLLADPRLQDPRPTSDGAMQAADTSHRGDPALDTADWPDDGPGNLRVSYVLPAATLTVTAAGVFWPAAADPNSALLGDDGLAAGPHHLVWVDLRR